jgi:lysylphosphatidylglycerol synthetase-like protein (DUF2156 family)
MDSANILRRIIPQRDMLSTIALMVLLLVVGSILIWQMVKLKKTIAQNATKCPTATSPLVMTILVLGCIMVALPLIVLVLNFSGFNLGAFKMLNMFENVLKTQTIIAVFAVITLGLVYILHVQLKACNMEIELPTWIASSVLAAGSLVLLGVRFYEDSKETKRFQKQIELQTQPQTLLGSIRSGLTSFGTNSANFVRRINPF